MNSERAVRVAVAFARQAAATPPGSMCDACVDVLQVSGAGVTLMTGLNSGPVCSSGPRSRFLEDLQFTLGEGPCRDAFATGNPIAEPDMQRSTATRWPNFTPPALHAGARGIFAFPMHDGLERIGVLTVHQSEPGVLSDDQMEDSAVLALVLAKSMVAIQERNDPEVLAGQLSDVNAHRAEVHQASGILAVALDITVREALVRLRAYAYSIDRTVADVAIDVVSGRLRLDDDRTNEEGFP